MANTIVIKQHNIYAFSCATDQSIAGNPILSAVLSNGVTTELAISNITDTSFIITLDTSSLPVGVCQMDIKIGNVSSDTVLLNILRNIA